MSALSEENIGGGTPKTSIKEYWDGKIPWIQSSDLQEHDVKNIRVNKRITEAAIKNSAAKLIPKNSLAIVMRVGVGKVSLIPFEYSTSQDFLSLSNLLVDKWFGTYLLYYKLQNELLALQGTSIKGITKKEVLDKYIYTPVNFKEQKLVGNIMSEIEKNINLHRRKINILKKMKQEYLKLLFVAYKKSLPKIRFAEFNDKWESNKLENYMSERTERSAKGELISVTIDSGVVKANSLQRKDNSSKDKSNYKIVRKGDIPYNSMRMWQGASGLSPHNGILSPAYTVLTPKANTSGAFFIYLFKTELLLYEFKKYSQGLTSDTWNLKYPLLKTINVQIPGIHEQRAIGEFLTKFDEVILIHNKKVNRLLKMKQVYLQKMFI